VILLCIFIDIFISILKAIVLFYQNIIQLKYVNNTLITIKHIKEETKKWENKAKTCLSHSFGINNIARKA